MHLKKGFTLIELSIVLVIIGLIVGGILAGKELVAGARLRSQITQIQQFMAATNTFRVKYNCLPGDCAKAADYGFVARGTLGGQGDGNDIIQGSGTDNGCIGATNSLAQGVGEPITYWMDLNAAGLIPGKFIYGSSTVANPGHVYESELGNYFPAAKLGGNNKVYVWSGYVYCGVPTGVVNSNYFGLVRMPFMWAGGAPLLERGIAAATAYAMDSKMDDGIPHTGRVVAGGILTYPSYSLSAIARDDTSCYDNSNTGGTPYQYSIMQTNENANCTMGFVLR